MKKIRNNKGFTLVELLAVIVVLAIVMGIAAVAITNVLDTTRKNAFVASARSYIAGAKTLVNSSEMDVLLGGDSTYAPVCSSDASKNTKTIPISVIKTEGGTNDKSPYGNAFTREDKKDGETITAYASYVQVKAEPITAGDYTECNNVFSIYLNDGIYELEDQTSGLTNTPVLESALKGDLVQTLELGPNS